MGSEMKLLKEMTREQEIEEMIKVVDECQRMLDKSPALNHLHQWMEQHKVMSVNESK